MTNIFLSKFIHFPDRLEKNFEEKKRLLALSCAYNKCIITSRHEKKQKK